MDDGLAEKLFNAFWANVCAHGWPMPCAWSELHETQRAAWEAAAVAAREAEASKINAEIEMLRGANDAWQRGCATMQTKLEHHVENVRAQTRLTMARFADVLNDAIHASPGESRAMLSELRDNLQRISVVS